MWFLIHAGIKVNHVSKRGPSTQRYLMNSLLEKLLKTVTLEKNAIRTDKDCQQQHILRKSNALCMGIMGIRHPYPWFGLVYVFRIGTMIPNLDGN